MRAFAPSASHFLSSREARSGFCEAEVHRLNGELLLTQDASNAAQAEQCFRTAIDIAHQQ